MPAKSAKGKKSADKDTGEKKEKKTRGKSSSSQPSSSQPSSTQPSSSQPSASQPSDSQPSASQHPSRQIRVGLSKAAKKMKPPEIEALEAREALEEGQAAQAEIKDGQEDMIVDGQEDADMTVDPESTDDTGMKSPAKKTPPKKNLPIEASRVKSPTKHPSYSRELENKFAAFFRENECLYNKAHPDYTNSNVKARLKHDFAEKHSTEHPGGLTGIMFCTNFFLFCIVSTLKKKYSVIFDFFQILQVLN